MADASLVFQRLATDNAIGAIQDQSNFVMSRAFHLLGTDNKSIEIPQFDTDDLLRCEFGFVGPDGSYPEAELAMDNISYVLQKAGLDQPVFDGDEDEIKNIVQVKAKTGVVKAYRFIEKLGIATFLADTSFNELQTGTAAGSGANEFLTWLSATSRPLEDVASLKEKVFTKTGLEADSMMVTGDVHTRLMHHPDIVARLSTTSLQLTTEQILAQVFGVDNYYITKGVENTSNKGNATQTKAYQATQKVLLYHKGASEDKEVAAAGRIAYKNQEGGRLVSVFTLEDIYREKTIVRSKANFNAGVQSKDLGIVLKNVLASVS